MCTASTFTEWTLPTHSVHSHTSQSGRCVCTAFTFTKWTLCVRSVHSHSSHSGRCARTAFTFTEWTLCTQNVHSHTVGETVAEQAAALKELLLTPEALEGLWAEVESGEMGYMP